MTLTIAKTFEAFDQRINESVDKIAKMINKQTLVPNSNRALDQTFVDEHCTWQNSETEWPLPQQKAVSHLKPLWDNLLKLKLGRQSDLEISSILLVFKEDEDYGICSFDSLETKDREADLRKIR